MSSSEDETARAFEMDARSIDEFIANSWEYNVRMTMMMMMMR